MALVVAVMAGSVEVDFSGEKATLTAGARRVFAAGKGKSEAGKPKYVEKGLDGAWKDKGRIVGLSRNAPRFELTIVSAFGRAVKDAESEKLEGGKRAYEAWLPPGTYTMRVHARGYKTLELKNLKVKAGTDLRIDLEFTPGG